MDQLLFLIYVNDLTYVTDISCNLMFADTGTFVNNKNISVISDMLIRNWGWRWPGL